MLQAQIEYLSSPSHPKPFLVLWWLNKPPTPFEKYVFLSHWIMESTPLTKIGMKIKTLFQTTTQFPDFTSA